ncbi:MAG: reactive intermediate/imine deaminase [Elusimicrobia bacterium GWA2_56_46]|nr:MAG: reactive intermediate/imine deaminase [Elusimicrobia bacterium GWA2_56_46]OGR55765.1 MAG: reactive intermediate/imine deaminase [Elusimicrobia bacterium GWC2_56_31]HBB66651.1 reactive intermediate/imine deaminase [Elusimicrobiota bacterium]HBW23574.1 reactive intermediate/imine deaminase [Elusimicrobiota bacterium]
MKTIISTPGAPAAIGPYSQAVEAGPFIFISGQLPVDPATGNIAGADTAAQTEAVIKNIAAILGSRGLTLENVVKTTVFMADLREFQKMNEVYARFFAKNPPARATIEVKALPKAALVEIEAIAVKQ